MEWGTRGLCEHGIAKGCVKLQMESMLFRHNLCARFALQIFDIAPNNSKGTYGYTTLCTTV